MLATTAALAADLPVKAKAVEYVRICSLYGANFFYVPGTDTCIRLGGYFRADVTFNGSIHGQPAWYGDLGQQNRYRDYFAARSRMALLVDTRTATEYGVVRTLRPGRLPVYDFGSNTQSEHGHQVAPIGSGNPLDTRRRRLRRGRIPFIQFAGFTFGKSSSAYSTPWNAFPGNIISCLIGGTTPTPAQQHPVHRRVWQWRIGLDRSRRPRGLEPHRRRPIWHPGR